jgi:hypothetical protein
MSVAVLDRNSDKLSNAREFQEVNGFSESMERVLLCASKSFNVHDLQQVGTIRDSTCSENDSPTGWPLPPPVPYPKPGFFNRIQKRIPRMHLCRTPVI